MLDYRMAREAARLMNDMSAESAQQLSENPTLQYWAWLLEFGEAFALQARMERRQHEQEEEEE